MIVIGGYESNNTKKLHQICQSITKAIHIESKDELSPNDIAGKKIIGITAGASTPKELIDDLIDYLNASN